MHPKASIFIIAIALLAGAFVVRAQSQDDDQTVRGAFLTSRPATPASSAPRANRPRRRRPARTNTTGRNSDQGTSPKSSTQPTSGNDTVAKNGSESAVNPPAAKPAPIGLGYTMYLRDSRGEAVRVDPSREFHSNDSIRIALESNTDGYLYVFHTENDGAPEMIFPDPRLEGGNNEIDAHVPYEVPSSKETDERFRWFTFYGKPATERLYIVVTRDPMPNIPTDNELVEYCRANQQGCPWHPSSEMWAKIKSDANAHVVVTKSKDFGQAQTPSEREATSRGLGLDKSAPPPSVIRMNASSATGVLVTALDLVHK